jgi:hypothetical protein
MTDELARQLGEAYWGTDSPNCESTRDCKHCGYDIPNDEHIFLDSWVAQERLDAGHLSKSHVQWSPIHILCVAQNSLAYMASLKPDIIDFELV